MWLKYSDAPILNGEQWDCEQSDYIGAHTKPSGFWITDDTADCWRSWCLGERFGLGRLTHKHEVVLDESNLLILRSPYELDLFTRDFAVEKLWGPQNAWRELCVDWRAVAARYDGLIITPYQWSRRLHDRYSWYYGWDCASGCVWKAGAIREVRLIEIDHEITKPEPAETEAA